MNIRNALTVDEHPKYQGDHRVTACLPKGWIIRISTFYLLTLRITFWLLQSLDIFVAHKDGAQVERSLQLPDTIKVDTMITMQGCDYWVSEQTNCDSLAISLVGESDYRAITFTQSFPQNMRTCIPWYLSQKMFWMNEGAICVMGDNIHIHLL